MDDDLEILRKIIHQLEEELDGKHQQAYTLKKEVHLLSDVMIPEIRQEVERSQIEKEEEVAELMKKVKEETATLNALNIKNADKVQDLNELIETLMYEKIELECALMAQTNSRNDKTLDKSTKESTNEQCLLEDVEREISELKEKKLNLNSAMLELKNILESRTFNCSDISNKLEAVKDKIKCAEAESKAYIMCNDVLKNKPLDPSKQGNSMFAAVNDSCQTVKEKMPKLEKQCSMYKNMLISQAMDAKRHAKEIEKLVIDLENMKDCVNVDNLIMNSFEEEIMELNKTSENYFVSLIKVIPVDKNKLDDPKDAEYIMSVMKNKWSDTVKPLKHLQKIIKDHFNTSQDLIKKNFELRILRRKSLQLSVKIKTSNEPSDILSFSSLESSFSEHDVNNSFKDHESNNETICQKLQNINLENLDMDMSYLSSVQSNIAQGIETDKAVISSSENSSVDLDEICKSDCVKNYYMLTPISPSSIE